MHLYKVIRGNKKNMIYIYKEINFLPKHRSCLIKRLKAIKLRENIFYYLFF